MGKFLMKAAALLAIAATGSAQAVNLDINGRGQVLLYPYYTVNKGQQTLLSVTNSASVAQAATVRFREGYNGREVLSFQIFLSPFDSWSATVFALSDAGLKGDGAAILTRDTSCTAPLFSEDQTSIGGTPYVAFREFAFLFPGDGGPTTIDRTREGSVEIIAMSNLGAPFASAIAHSSTGAAPTGCAQVRNLLGSEAGLEAAPSGGLMGVLSIINAAEGTRLSARAEALAGFTGVPVFASLFSDMPNLSSANDGAGILSFQATARIIDPAGKALSLTYPGPDPRSRRVDAVSAVLMADRFYNEYQMSSGLTANSDWVVALPTKAFYVDSQYIGASQVNAIPPFTRVYDGAANATSRFSRARFSRSVFSSDGVESSRGFGCGFLCPPGPQPPSLSRSVNVIPITTSGVTESGVLGSRLVSSIVPAAGEGTVWPNAGVMRVNLDPTEEPHALLSSTDGKVLRGLPVMGFWASNNVNGNAAETVLVNYASAVRHATSLTCIKNQQPCD